MEAALSLGKNGLQDWVIQRITALVLALYTFFMFFYLWLHPMLSFAEWHLLFSSQWMRYASLITLLCLLSHAWIGLWTISTDYIKITAVRFLVQMVFILGLLACFFWGLHILWGGVRS